jgi:hypothetical protein
MKNIIILGLCLIFIPVQAQKIIEKHMNFSQKESVVLNIQIADSIVIHTWDKKEVFAKASVDVNDNKDNDAYQTGFDESGSIIKVTAKFEDNYLSGKSDSSGSHIFWDVYIPEKVNFSVKTIDGNINISGKAGDIDAKTISGHIIITGTNSKTDANSISGFIDMSVASDVKADLEFKTISGTIYSNHEIPASGKKSPGSNKVVDQMNGGGLPIKLKTISGNIYFRKI